MNLIIEGPGGAREVPLERGLLTIGRGSDCDVILQEPLASRRHAELRRLGDQWLVVDLGSTNGTLLDGRRLVPHQPAPLPPGQAVTIGASRLALRGTPAYQPPLRFEEPALPGASVEALPAPGPAPAAQVLIWFSRLVAVAAAVALAVGSQSDWVRISARLPVVGRVFDRTFDGMDSGYGWLLILAAAVGLLLVVLDLLVRRAGAATGLGQLLIAAFTAAALGVTAYNYYQAGSQSVFGISLLDVFTEYARDVVELAVRPGIYLVAAGLGGLIIAGLLRIIAAGAAARQ